MRWAYSDGSGSSDWYCERVWCAYYAHKWRDRSKFQKAMAKDLKIMTDFENTRKKFIDDRKKGKRYIAYKRGEGVKKTRVEQQSSYQTELVMSSDDFYPMQAYIDKFGSLDDPANKRMKHVKTKVNGVKGVIVPAGPPEGPWKVSRKLVDSVKKAELMEDDNSDDGADPDAVDQKFEEMVAERSEAYEKAAVGTIAALLKEVGSDTTLASLEAKKVLAADAAPTQTMQEDNDADSCKGGSPSRRQRRRFTLSSRSDEDRTTTVKKVPKGLRKRVKMGAQRSNGGGCSFAGKATRASEPLPTPPTEPPAESDGAAQRGRKALPIQCIAQSHIEAIRTADTTSLYFG